MATVTNTTWEVRLDVVDDETTVSTEQGAMHLNNDNCFFNCVQDSFNEWFLFLSDSDKAELVNTQYAYLLDIQKLEYIAPVIENPFN